jgi:outer membrane protein
MIKKLITCSLTVLLLCFLLPLRADDLMQIYYQALNSDPTFKKAEADWMTTRENYPLARSGNGTPGSGLFPYIDVSGDVARTYQRQSSAGISSSGFFDGNAYLLELTQPIFNYATWKSISGARFQVRAAAATYISAAQDLMFRVSQAYFNVLMAYDELQYTLSSKRSYLHQLITAQQKFQVGLIAITGVYDAQASYDQSVAQEIQDRNSLQDQLENLRAITGRSYQVISGLRNNIPLVIPRPQNIENWVSIADQQNYKIKSNLYTMLSAREYIKQARAAGYPTLTGTLQYGAITYGTIPFSGQTVDIHGNLSSITVTTAQGALNLNFPVYQGGFVSHNSKQAEYKYLSASDQLEFTHRDVVRQTRQAYLGVQSGISKVRADRQTIISSANKLEATQAGYDVGTRTMVDVLQAVSQLYQSQQQWANDRYNYVLNIISLKEQAGTLSPSDLASINTWLSKPITLLPKKSVAVKTKFCKKKPREKAPTVILKKLPKPTKQNATPPKGGLPTPQYHGSRAALPHLAGIKQAKIHKNLSLNKSITKQTKNINAMNYAIQVFAARDISQAHDFINQQTEKQQLHIVKLATQPDWYKVVYGQFATEKQAQQALQHLPRMLTKNKPWIVNVAETFKNAAPSIAPQSAQPVAELPAPATAPTAEDKITSFEVNQ